LWLLSFPTAMAAEKPNIVMIYADDVGYGDLGCYGGIGADTPNIDRLAAGGIRFLSGYSTAATCTPSRYSLLTGEYAFRNREAEILPGNAPLIIDPRRPTVASFLRDNGYATALVGKWHLGLGQAGTPLDWNGLIRPGPRELGFDYSFHMAATADRVPSVYIENGRIVGLDPSDPVRVSYKEQVGADPTGLSHPEGLKWRADKQHSGTIVNGISRIGFMSGGRSARFRDEDMADTYVTKAEAFIRQNKDGPFFLYFAPNENHVPRAVHERFQDTSTLGPRGDALTALDWSVGRLLETLKAEGVYENTLIIFSSDNGPVLFDGYQDSAILKRGDHRAAGPWGGGKYGRWEGGTRVPFIVAWPAGIAPGISEALLSQVDLFATFAALLGRPMPARAGADGVNVLPALLGEAEKGRDYVVQEAWKQLAIRRGGWKYLPPGTVSERGGWDEWKVRKIEEPGLLFYLTEDPGETRNIASHYPGKVKELRRLLEQAVSGPGKGPARAFAAKPVAAWLAPVQEITNIVCKPPDGILFDSSGEAVWRLNGTMPDRATTVVLRPESGAWDVSRFGYFRVDLANTGPGLVWIRGRLDNPGAKDWQHSTPSQAFLMPGERATLGFPYSRPAGKDDAPAIFDKQNAKPNAFRTHWKQFNPSRVLACRLRIQSTSSTLSLEDIVVSAAQPYGAEANAELLEMPYLDAFGQVRKLDWPGKLHDAERLVRRRDEEAAALATDHGPGSFNKYGGWADGPQLEATGFFRTEKVNGKWWLVDPEGRLFFSHGCNSVGFDQVTLTGGREELFAWLPRTDDHLMQGVVKDNRVHFMVANLARSFGADWREPVLDRVHRRLRRWGMNTLGAWSDPELVEDRRTPYTAIVHAGGDWSALGHGVSDPFDEEFKEQLAKGLRGVPGANENDPWCIGVFIDNEIDWTEKFVHKAFRIGPGQPARREAVTWLEGKYGEIAKLNEAWGSDYTSWEEIGALPETETEAFEEDIASLTRLIAGEYYKTCRNTMRDVLPNHLYLGSRMHKAPNEVIEEAVKYVDVLSLNSYEPLSGSKVPKGADVPCLDTEFHFAAPDRGLPSVGLWPVGDQVQRSRAYVAYVVSGVLHSNVVGTHWFAYSDQSAAGRPGNGENHQIGFVDVTDTPYPEITDACRNMAERMYAVGTNKTVNLLSALESIWSRAGKAAAGAPPAKSEIGFPYRIAKADGIDVQPAADGHIARGKGGFRLILKPAVGKAWNMDAVSVLGLAFRNTGKTDLVRAAEACGRGLYDGID